jgi:hypothetical protein
MISHQMVFFIKICVVILLQMSTSLLIELFSARNVAVIRMIGWDERSFLETWIKTTKRIFLKVDSLECSLKFYIFEPNRIRKIRLG